MAYTQYLFFEEEEDDTGFGSIVFFPVDEFRQSLLNPHDLRGCGFEISHINHWFSGITTMSLSCHYEVRSLRRDDDLERENEYVGQLRAMGKHGRVLVSMPVKIVIEDLQDLNQAQITFRDGDEYYEFLYDTYKKIIVKEEEPNLARAVRYRRYVPLFTDECVYIIKFLAEDRRASAS